jgi:photosystem II stability/assembly factor-like uncharacterized protein
MLARSILLNSLALAWGLTQAQAQAPAPLTYSGAPLKITFDCDPERLQELGLVCLEDEPCIVYTEFTAVQAEASRILLAGNLHTESATAASLLLMSEDGGATWTEPYARVRMGSLEQIQFASAPNSANASQTGWVSGQIVQSLSRDPFFLVTKDGGKTWRRRSIYSEPTIATLEGFRFDGAQNGEAILSTEGHSQRWLTRNAGDTWQMSESSTTKMAAPPAPTPDATWRIRSDAKLKAHVVEHRQGQRFSAVSSFLIESARCAPMPVAPLAGPTQ